MGKVLVIAGPTGVGKTDLAVQLARRLGGELVSCDSVQVYRHLEIGANKEHFEEPPQHLIDFVNPREAFTAADFYGHCFACLKDITGRGKVPILVGGTGFYMDWLVRGRPSAPPTDPSVLAAVERELEGLAAWPEKLARLEQADPEYASVLMENDVYRLTRALCVHRQTGRPISSFGRQPPAEYDWRCFYLTTDREALGRRIDLRCEKMIQAGLIQETRSLLDAELLQRESPPSRAIGYQQTIDFLDSIHETTSVSERVSRFQAYLESFQAATRQYSRRQETWFRRMPEFKWIQREDLSRPFTESLVSGIISWFRLEKDCFNADPPLLHQDSTTRRLMAGDQAANRKRMKTYTSHQEIFPNPPHIQAFLESIKLVPNSDLPKIETNDCN